MLATVPLIDTSFPRLLKPALCMNLSTHLYDDMSRQSVDNNGFLSQGQRRYYFLSKLLDVPFNLPYSSLVEVTAAFGEVIYWQLL